MSGRNVTEPQSVGDIFDEHNYKLFRCEHGTDILTLQFNFYGVPVFKSSSFSLHPILVFLNEHPP